MPTARIAAFKALNTTELLESIILKLQCKDVLLVQRVSKQWRATVVSSLALQKSLCLAPCERLDIEDQNPLPGFLNPGSLVGISAEDFLAACSTGDGMPNPLLSTLFRPSNRQKGYLQFEHSDAKLIESTHASWRNMYITQPAATKVAVIFIVGDISEARRTPSFQISQGHHRIDNPAGVTITDLIEYVRGKHGGARRFYLFTSTSAGNV